MKNIIVAVVGLCGAGKSEVTNMFVENKFEKVYFGDVTFDELKKRNMEITEENERVIREELRSTNDMAIYAKKSEPKIKKAYEEGKNVVVESLYSWSEYKYLKEIYKDSFKLLAVVTDRDLRAERLKNRPHRPLTDEEVTSRDYSQIENTETAGPIAIADHFVLNNGTFEELKKQVQEYIDFFI
ncbi:MAG: AAA family ATPase [Candidatus Dojkabacteria bacterium]|jgi:dephospho-CoA kinase